MATIPASTASYTVTTSSGNAGVYSYYYSDAKISSCVSGSGLPVGTTNDFCYNIEFDDSSLKYNIYVSTTQYSPVRYRLSLSPTNAILQDSSTATVGSNVLTLTVQGRPPPTGSAVAQRLIGYIASASSPGVNMWYQFSFTHYYVYGDAAAVPTSGYKYWIPWIGSYNCGQGNGGTFSHNVGTADEFAIDITMNEGTAIYASRDGYVSFVEESNSQSAYDACPGNPTSCNTVGAQNNYVYVVHAGTTFLRCAPLFSSNTNYFRQYCCWLFAFAAGRRCGCRGPVCSDWRLDRLQREHRTIHRSSLALRRLQSRRSAIWSIIIDQISADLLLRRNCGRVYSCARAKLCWNSRTTRCSPNRAALWTGRLSADSIKFASDPEWIPTDCDRVSSHTSWVSSSGLCSSVSRCITKGSSCPQLFYHRAQGLWNGSGGEPDVFIIAYIR